MIYFIASPSMNAVKIGRTKNPTARLIQIQRNSADILHLLTVLHGPASLEARMHTHFMPFHLHGEWFRWDGWLRSEVNAMIDGTFDLSCIPDNGKKAWCIARRASGMPSPNGRPYRVAIPDTSTEQGEAA